MAEKLGTGMAKGAGPNAGAAGPPTRDVAPVGAKAQADVGSKAGVDVSASVAKHEAEAVAQTALQQLARSASVAEKPAGLSPGRTDATAAKADQTSESRKPAAEATGRARATGSVPPATLPAPAARVGERAAGAGAGAGAGAAAATAAASSTSTSSGVDVPAAVTKQERSDVKAPSERSLTPGLGDGASTGRRERDRKPPKARAETSCKRGKVALPYDPASLDWDASHWLNAQDQYCYCGRGWDAVPEQGVDEAERKINSLLRCAKCRNAFHLPCVKVAVQPRPVFADETYVFICANCDGSGAEKFRPSELSWPEAMLVALINLRRQHPTSSLFNLRDDVLPFFEQVFPRLCNGKSMAGTWKKSLSSALSSHQDDLFTSGQEVKGRPGFWGLGDASLVRVVPSTIKVLRKPKPRHTGAPTASAPGTAATAAATTAASAAATAASSTVTTTAAAAAAAAGESTGAALDTEAAAAAAAKAERAAAKRARRRERERRRAAERAEGKRSGDGKSDKEKRRASRKRRGAGDSNHAPNKRATPLFFWEKVRETYFGPPRWSAVFHAPQITASDDRLTVTNEKGYRMTMATLGARRGRWFFELAVEWTHEDSATRLGWTARNGDKQGPCGYDKYSYGFRSVAGDVFHESRGRGYGSGYGSGDVIGCAIVLPGAEDPDIDDEEDKDGAVIAPAQEFSSFAAFKAAGPPKLPEGPRIPQPGTYMEFFINGESQGRVFPDLPDQRYYPAASLFRGARVVANFGPSFKHAPPRDAGAPLDDWQPISALQPVARAREDRRLAREAAKKAAEEKAAAEAAEAEAARVRTEEEAAKARAEQEAVMARAKEAAAQALAAAAAEAAQAQATKAQIKDKADQAVANAVSKVTAASRDAAASAVAPTAVDRAAAAAAAAASNDGPPTSSSSPLLEIVSPDIRVRSAPGSSRGASPLLEIVSPGSASPAPLAVDGGATSNLDTDTKATDSVADAKPDDDKASTTPAVASETDAKAPVVTASATATDTVVFRTETVVKTAGPSHGSTAATATEPSQDDASDAAVVGAKRIAPDGPDGADGDDEPPVKKQRG